LDWHGGSRDNVGDNRPGGGGLLALFGRDHRCGARMTMSENR
jgi:hypothetical protein